jgi:hypothetical protein
VGLFNHSPRVIYTDDPTAGKELRCAKRHETRSSADVENPIRRFQMRQFYHPHRDRCAEALGETVELGCDLIVARGIYVLIIHDPRPMVMQKWEW